MRRRIFYGLLFLAQFAACDLMAQNAILGYWMDENQETIVEIYQQDDVFNGRVVWIKDSLDVFGNQRRDVMNEKPDLRSRKVIGLDMLIGFKWDGEDAWRKGDIYYYHNGNDYNGKIHLDEYGNLKLKGYYSILFFLGRTKTWKRPDHLERYALQ